MSKLSQAMHSLFGAPQQKSTPVAEKTLLPSPSFGGGISSSLGFSGVAPKKGTAELLAMYGVSPRLQAIVKRVSDSVASTPYHVIRPVSQQAARQLRNLDSLPPIPRAIGRRKLLEGGGIETLNHPVMDMLRDPNPHLTSRQTRFVTQAHLMLVGESFWLTEAIKGAPKKFDIYPLAPNWVTMPTAKSRNYVVNGGFWQNYEVATDSMVWFKDLNPAQPYGRGIGTGMVLGDEIQTDEYAAKTAASLLHNHGVPPYLIKLKGAKTEALERFRIKWAEQNRGPLRVSEPFITDVEDLTVQKLGATLADMGLAEQREFEAKIIRETWGIPPEILGVIENSNRATIDAAYSLFATLVLAPQLVMWEDLLNNRVMPKFDPSPTRPQIMFENPIPEDRDFILQVISGAPSAFTVNEIRDLAGLDPVDGGDEFFGGEADDEEFDEAKGEEELRIMMSSIPPYGDIS